MASANDKGAHSAPDHYAMPKARLDNGNGNGITPNMANAQKTLMTSTATRNILDANLVRARAVLVDSAEYPATLAEYIRYHLEMNGHALTEEARHNLGLLLKEAEEYNLPYKRELAGWL